MRRDLKRECTSRYQNSNDQTTLDLSQFNIQCKDIPQIVDFLKENPNITSLNLSNNQIGSRGLKYFAKYNKTIKNLTLTQNDIITNVAINIFIYNKITTNINLTNNLIHIDADDVEKLKKYLESGKFFPPACFLLMLSNHTQQKMINSMFEIYHFFYNSFYHCVTVYFEFLKIMQHNPMVLKEIRHLIGFFLIFANTDGVTINRRNLIEHAYTLPVTQRITFFQPSPPLPDALSNLWDTINQLLSELENEYVENQYYVTHIELSGSNILITFNLSDAATYFYQLCLNQYALKKTACSINRDQCLVCLHAPDLTVQNTSELTSLSGIKTALYYDNYITTHESQNLSVAPNWDDWDWDEAGSSDNEQPLQSGVVA